MSYPNLHPDIKRAIAKWPVPVQIENSPGLLAEAWDLPEVDFGVQPADWQTGDELELPWFLKPQA